jgi:hypothetical protein
LGCNLEGFVGKRFGWFAGGGRKEMIRVRTSLGRSERVTYGVGFKGEEGEGGGGRDVEGSGEKDGDGGRVNDDEGSGSVEAVTWGYSVGEGVEEQGDGAEDERSGSDGSN